MKNYYNVPVQMILYDMMYAMSDALFKYFEPCKIYKLPETLKLTCHPVDTPNNESQQCCSSCKHLGDKGCQVKCLMCKLFYCWCIEENSIYKPLTSRLNLIHTVAYKFPYLLHIRQSRVYTVNVLNAVVELNRGIQLKHIRSD